MSEKTVTREDFVNHLKSYDVDERKSMLKRLKKDLKEVRKGKMRKYFLTHMINDTDMAYNLCKMEDALWRVVFESEKERVAKVYEDEEFAKQCGWYSKKQTPQQLEKWSNEVTLRINPSEVDLQFEVETLEESLRS